METTPDPDRTELVHGITHGFKNVITALRMGCDLVEQKMRGGDTAGAAEFLGEMRKELENGSALVKRLQDLR